MIAEIWCVLLWSFSTSTLPPCTCTIRIDSEVLNLRLFCVQCKPAIYLLVRKIVACVAGFVPSIHKVNLLTTYNDLIAVLMELHIRRCHYTYSACEMYE